MRSVDDRAPAAYFLVGPTASGKSDVAQRIAEMQGFQIVSADSMLVYRDMDIGTAKPAADARSGVPYHGLDLVDPDQSFHVEAWLSAVAPAFRGEQAAMPTIVTGGTGLYLRCLVEGLNTGAPPDSEQRARWEGLLTDSGIEALQAELLAKDPQGFESLADKENARRLIRALESVGNPPTDSWSASPQHTPFVGFSLSPELLHSRIESRVKDMYRRGLIEEVERLVSRYPQWSDTARQAIGYAEALRHRQGELSLDAAIERTVIRTRQLAKRQRTWFRHQANVVWLEIEDGMQADEIAADVIRLWDEQGPTKLQVKGE